MSIHDQVHTKILKSKSDVDDWFKEKRVGLKFPLYSSFDIRDSGCKIAPVDANLYPAGFNNICLTDQDSAVDLMKTFLTDHYEDVKTVMLFTEEHTGNPYYADNARAIKTILERAGFDAQIAWPRKFESGSLTLETASGATIDVQEAHREGAGVMVNGKAIDLVISNNDFTQKYDEFMEGLETPVNPPYQLGWHNRRKDKFFTLYNELVGEFSQLIGLTPCLLRIFTETHNDFDINDEESRKKLALHVDEFLDRIRGNYSHCSVQYEPYVYIKNSAGTYGLGVTTARSGKDVEEWNNKTRKKMKAAKGGGGIQQVILQEGVPTEVSESGNAAEPVIYMLGCQLAGGFLRTHDKKGATESLNSPGAVYKRLCVSDLNVSVEGNPLENVYGWIAKIGFLALAREAREMNADFSTYR
ncbi:MAG: glutamate--cysteine ligase [Bdellovibrionaceae bacterium]|nr:glutamate--cysteine ligase [Pseudobdellovibrionaceae bacterium]|tara:strand:- start:52191 stop:53432 length:1242 start_codon:yes stop_codon:yes gene_type:complete